MAYLSLRAINKIYPNGFHAVHNFNLNIEKGEFIVFVGPSGCGKSTTLRMIAGLEDISNGEFLINGQRANEWGPQQRQVAMVFQSYALYPQMTVYDNIAFGLTLMGVDEDEIDARVKKTAGILGLTDYLDRLPRALSGGQRQRVAIGRAIIRKVGIFLMDEPLSNLDAKQRVTMRAEIAQIHRQTKATTIYQDPAHLPARRLADGPGQGCSVHPAPLWWPPAGASATWSLHPAAGGISLDHPPDPTTLPGSPVPRGSSPDSLSPYYGPRGPGDWPCVQQT